MGREILFKAKRTDNGEWVEGLLIMMFGQYHIQKLDDENTAYSIDQETICQYTGLRDKNGKKIWENDILKFPDMGEEGYEYKEGYDFDNIARVVWKNGRFELDEFGSLNSGVVDSMGRECHEEFISIFKVAEVIGNIFDNPELLEEK